LALFGARPKGQKRGETKAKSGPKAQSTEKGRIGPENREKPEPGRPPKEGPKPGNQSVRKGTGRSRKAGKQGKRPHLGAGGPEAEDEKGPKP